MLSTPTEITNFVGNNIPRLPVRNLQSLRLPIIRSQPLTGVVHTVYTYIVYARECVCNFSGFSKKIPRLESPLERSLGALKPLDPLLFNIFEIALRHYQSWTPQGSLGPFNPLIFTGSVTHGVNPSLKGLRALRDLPYSYNRHRFGKIILSSRDYEHGLFQLQNHVIQQVADVDWLDIQVLEQLKTCPKVPSDDLRASNERDHSAQF